MNSKPILSISHVDFSFGATTVLRDISFELAEGDFLGLIGPNGSGKTTLLKLILGVYPVQHGSITLCGEWVDSFTKWENIGYVPQKASNIQETFPATVFEVVSMGLMVHKKFPKLLSGNDRTRIHQALQKVNMEQFKEKRIGELSGGQQQRVLIARALVTEPKILFLDEPTTGIDQETQRTFYDLLKSLNDDGITIVLVSHDVGRITKYVTKVASLNQKLVFYGTHEAFCANDPDHRHDKAVHEHTLCLDKG